MIYWFYGQPGAGKTTLSQSLKQHLLREDPSRNIVQIDGDDMRKIYNNQDYTKNGRMKNLEKVTDVVRFLHNKDFVVIVSVVAPYLNMRRKISDLDPFMIHVWTNEIRGREHYHTRDMEIDKDDYSLNTDDKSVFACVEKIINYKKEIK